MNIEVCSDEDRTRNPQNKNISRLPLDHHSESEKTRTIKS